MDDHDLGLSVCRALVAACFRVVVLPASRRGQGFNTAGCCAPATGSAPASAVSILFRFRGASSPARYSRNPRRCAT